MHKLHDALIYISTVQVSVRVWERAAYELFGLTTDAMYQKWETGVEDAQQQETVLADLNAALAATVKCVCTGSIWSYGYKTVTHKTQINVNDLEVIA